MLSETQLQTCSCYPHVYMETKLISDSHKAMIYSIGHILVHGYVFNRFEDVLAYSFLFDTDSRSFSTRWNIARNDNFFCLLKPILH